MGKVEVPKVPKGCVTSKGLMNPVGELRTIASMWEVRLSEFKAPCEKIIRVAIVPLDGRFKIVPVKKKPTRRKPHV